MLNHIEERINSMVMKFRQKENKEKMCTLKKQKSGYASRLNAHLRRLSSNLSHSFSLSKTFRHFFDKDGQLNIGQ